MAIALIKVKKDEENVRLDRWFKRHFPELSHVSIEKALRKGNIRINGKRAKSALRLKYNDEIKVPEFLLKLANKPDNLEEKKKEFKPSPAQLEMLKKNILYKNDDILIINKPAGLAVQGGSKINISVDHLLDTIKFDNTQRPKLVHRLDKDTSGILLLARSSNQATKIIQLFKDKKIVKEYLAVIVGKLPLKKGRIDLNLEKKSANYEKVEVSEDGLFAITDYEVLETLGKEASLVKLMPITGRTHQLRVHMQAMNCPILGDGKYGGNLAFIDGCKTKLHLHAYKITIPLENAKPLIVTAPIPEHIKATFEYFNKSTAF